MPSVALRTLCLLLGLAAASPVLDDTSVLVQQSREQRAAPLSHVCSDKELRDHEAKVQRFHEKQAEKKKREQEKGKLSAQKFHAEADNRTAALLRPLLDALETMGKYLEAEVKPAGLTLITGFLQQLFDGPLLVNVTKIDINKTRDEFLLNWTNQVVPHVQSLLTSGFTSFQGKVDTAVSTYSASVQAHIPNPSANLSNGSSVQAYINQRALPVLLLETYPQLQEVAEILVKMPANQSLHASWAQATLLPYILKQLPDKCQPSRLFTTLGLGMGDIGNRIAKFADNCKVAMGMEVLPEPVRKCSTCQEHYMQQTLDASTMGSCMQYCMPVAIGCASGLNDACLHKFHPCLRCHKNKLQNLDKCMGTETRAKLTEGMDKLAKLFKTASIEKDKVNDFMDQLLEAMNI